MRAITDDLKASFDQGWKLMDQIIDVCPEAVWGKKAGGFVFWQQLYHCFACVDYFLMPKDGAIDAGPQGMEIAMLDKEPTAKVGKEEVRAYAAKMKAKADAWFETMDDESLSLHHEGFSARRGGPVSNAMLIAIMSGHSQYHVGGCDVILRDNGEKGVM